MFSLLLNDYEGGDFDLEYEYPSKDLRHATSVSVKENDIL